jgi:hypothetical protein
MKRTLLFNLLLLVAVPCFLHAQTMVMTPDNGSQGDDFSVTIAGIGTQFGTPQTVSMITVKLERSGILYDQVYPAYLDNDSTISGSLQIPTTMLGSYDLVVTVTHRSDTTVNIFTQDTAFYVTSATPSISYVSPSTAYDSQTVSVGITGLNTHFENGNTPTVYFQQNGTTYFSAQADTVSSNTFLNTSVTVASTAPTGYYDVVVQNNVYSDTGINKFTVLGPKPTVALVPDSGMTSSTFDVSVVGQGTDFVPGGGVSMPVKLNIDLKQNGITYYHDIADTVFSATLGKAIFVLSDSIAPGTYDAEIYGNGSDGLPYDLHTTFLVTSHHTTIHTPHPYSAPPADTVTLKINGHGVNFVSEGNQFIKIVRLVDGDFTIDAQAVKQTSDTSLSAFFSIPAEAAIGIYDLQIVEPGTGRIDTGVREFVVKGSYIDTSCAIAPDSGAQGQQAGGCLSGMDFGSATIDSMYLRQGATIIPVVVQKRLPPCLPIGIKIPSTATTGSYDFYLVLGGDGLGDTAVVKNAFTVQAPAGVDLQTFSDLVETVRVFPNPVQDNATISFTMSTPNHVHLWLYDELGRTVATLCDRELGTGAQTFDWASENVPAGSYFYELTAGEEMHGGRIVVRH